MTLVKVNVTVGKGMKSELLALRAADAFFTTRVLNFWCKDSFAVCLKKRPRRLLSRFFRFALPLCFLLVLLPLNFLPGLITGSKIPSGRKAKIHQQLTPVHLKSPSNLPKKQSTKLNHPKPKTLPTIYQPKNKTPL